MDLLIIIMLALAFVMAICAFAAVNAINPNARFLNKKAIRTILPSVMIFALLGFLAAKFTKGKLEWSMWLFFLFQILFLVKGIFQMRLMYKKQFWAKQESFLPEFFYLVAHNLLGYVAFFLAFWFPGVKALATEFSWCTFSFLIPYLCWKSWLYFLEIPERKFKSWKIPVGKELPIMEPIHVVKLDLHIPRNADGAELVKFDVNAPGNRTLGELFYYLLYRNNVEVDPERPIQVFKDESKSGMFEWLMYRTEKNWLFLKKKIYLDPDVEIRNQRLQDNTVINLKRSY